MNQVYSNIAPTTGAFSSGICKIQIAPKEWLLDDIEIDFNTGTVISQVLLRDQLAWINLDLTENSYEFEEKPKSSKGGPFFEITIAGLVNNLTPELLQVLSTLSHHELIAILKDRQRRLKIVGTMTAGLVFQFGNREITSNGGTQTINIDLTMQSEDPAPFYIP